MMHKCGGSHGNMGGPCSCGLFQSQSNSFSMPQQKSFDETDMYSFLSPHSPPSSSVDCTLSLGTPSTRLSEDDEKRIHHDQRRSGSCMTNFCWDFLQTKYSSYAPQNHKTSSGSNGNTINYNSTSDPLLARRCANCDTTSTPLWRNGPRGPKSLCNACGIRFKKEERRVTAANANTNGENASGVADQHHGYYNNSWLHQTQTPNMPCYTPAANEFRFVEYGDQSSDNTGIPFLSWKLNVADRPGLVHDFKR